MRPLTCALCAAPLYANSAHRICFRCWRDAPDIEAAIQQHARPNCAASGLTLQRLRRVEVYREQVEKTGRIAFLSPLT